VRRTAAALGALVVVIVALLAVAPAPARAESWTDADYWKAADRLQERLDNWWVKRLGTYKPGDLSADTMVNANMLLVHATAALSGHEGPARRDDRVRLLAARMLESPPFVAEIDSEAMAQVHAPGWLGSLTARHSIQHLIVDAEVAEAMAAAWRARDVVGLPPELSALIAQRLREVARGPFWRYPAIRLNQINWYASVYSAAAETNGDAAVLSRDLRAQVVRFVHGVQHPRKGTAGNLGAGMRFNYVPDRSVDWSLNFDSPEYANLVASFARTWDAARAAGMPDISRPEKAIIRQWMTRVLAGYWTHAGYLNWDTGFGFRRLHQAKKLPLAQQGLLAIAAGGDLTPGPVVASWAKTILDHGFELYLRWLPEGEGLPPALLFDLSERRQPPAHAVLAAARVESNIARAVALGLGHRVGRVPPPLYAYDPDVGRLAVTTPHYSTAIVPVNNGAFPYGGVDLARLFDGRQEVAGSIGGVPPASFGMVVRKPSGHTILATQRPLDPGPRRQRSPLQLLQAPAGVNASPRSKPTRAFAGGFRTLKATGAVHRGSVSARSTYRFTSSIISATWNFRATRIARRTVQVQFPSWGGDLARVWAVAPDGWTREILNYRSLAGVRFFYVQSEHSGYAVIPHSNPANVRARVVHPARQSSAPRPGPTLLLERPNTTATALEIGADIITAPTLEAARKRVGRRLAARG
jgi:hypothetical protein